MAVGIIALFVALSAVVHERMTSFIEADEQMRFRTAAEGRHTRLVARLEQNQRLLESAVSLFRFSRQVEPDEFQRYSEPLVRGGLGAVCWSPTVAGEPFRAGPRADACSAFDLLEPSRVLAEEPPLIMLSAFADSAGRPGYLSFVFDFPSLFAEQDKTVLREYLLINHRSKNAVSTYSIDAQELLPSAPRSPRSTARNADFDMVSLGNVRFVYMAEPPPASGRHGLEDLLALSLFGLGLFGGLYVRSVLLARQAIEREVERRTAELTEFAYRTSHDLRGPLVTVAGLSRVLREDAEEGDFGDVAEVSGRIEEQVSRLATLVDDILSLARADQEKERVEPIAIDELISQVFSAVRGTPAGRGVDLEASEPLSARPHLPPARLERILENLVSNGAKYADPDKERSWVRVHARRVGGDLVIEVSDNGLGIAPEHQGRVFEKFQRFHPDAGAGGSGLGLAIVERDLHQLGGSIRLESSRAGTTFIIAVPRVEWST